MTTVASCSELAELLGGSVLGDATLVADGVASLDEARPSDVSFLGNPKYVDRVLPSQAGIVIVPPNYEVEPPPGRAWIVCDDPSNAFSKVVALFAPPPVAYPAGVHDRAVVADTASLGEGVHVGAGAVICDGAEIGARSVIAAGVYIGEGTRVGEDCLLYPNVTIRERCILGNRIIIHPGSVVGSDGFGYVSGPEGHKKIPQVGIVQIDDDVELGAQVAVDRARFGRTWIKTGAKVDNLVQIAHNVVIEEHCMIIAQVGISGSTRIGAGAILAGQAGLAGHLEIGPQAIVMAQSGVSKDVPARTAVMGTPAVERRRFAKMQSCIKRIERYEIRFKELQEALAQLRAQLDELSAAE